MACGGVLEEVRGRGGRGGGGGGWTPEWQCKQDKASLEPRCSSSTKWVASTPGPATLPSHPRRKTREWTEASERTTLLLSKAVHTNTNYCVLEMTTLHINSKKNQMKENPMNSCFFSILTRQPDCPQHRWPLMLGRNTITKVNIP